MNRDLSFFLVDVGTSDSFVLVLLSDFLCFTGDGFSGFSSSSSEDDDDDDELLLLELDELPFLRAIGDATFFLSSADDSSLLLSDEEELLDSTFFSTFLGSSFFFFSAFLGSSFFFLGEDLAFAFAFAFAFSS